MALDKITWADKVAINPQPSIARENKCTNEDLNEIKRVVNGAVDKIEQLPKVYIYSSNTSASGTNPSTSITFTAPVDGIIELNGSWCGWGFGGNEITIDITNTTGSATLLASYGEKTTGHDTNAVPINAKAYYLVEKDTQYTFSAQITGASGTGNNIYLVATLREEINQ